MVFVHKWLFGLGALLGFTGVAAGAFGAHALKNKLTQEMFTVFEAGVRYQMYHALAILIVALLAALIPSSLLNAAGWLFFAGTLIFSGSLYLLVLTGVRSFGMATPLGGVILLLGWLTLILKAFRL